MTTRTIEGMAVEIDGAGETVVMVHGLGGTSNTFTPLMPNYGERRTVRPDLVGSGRSPLQGSLSIARFVDDLVRAMAALGIREAHFVAHSMGTILCQHLAVREPRLVRSLTLLGALIEPADAARAALRQRAEKARTDGMADIADAIVRGALAKDTPRDMPVAIATVRESIMRQCPHGYAATCEALAGATAVDASRIECPTLLITGEEDAVAPQAVARTLADRLPQARLVLLPRCGHWPSFERAADTMREMRHFDTSLTMQMGRTARR